MKKLFLLLCFIPLFAFSQEPEFIGEINIKDDAGNYVLLEKQPACSTTQTDIGVYLFGIGSIKTRYVVQHKYSNVRLANGKDVELIARSADNSYDPVSTIAIFRFKTFSEERKADFSSNSTFAYEKDFILNIIDYKATKYGEGSYKITLNNIPDGEYGVIQFNPRQDNNRLLIISCFGIGGKQKYKPSYDTDK